jgi:hypothetical protein
MNSSPLTLSHANSVQIGVMRSSLGMIRATRQTLLAVIRS